METKDYIVGFVIIAMGICLWVNADAKIKTEARADLADIKLVTAQTALATIRKDRDAIRSESTRRRIELVRLMNQHRGVVDRMQRLIDKLGARPAVVKETRVLVPVPEVELTDREKLNALQKASKVEYEGEVKVRFDRHREDVIDRREHQQQVEVNRSRPYRRGYRGTVHQQQYGGR